MYTTHVNFVDIPSSPPAPCIPVASGFSVNEFVQHSCSNADAAALTKIRSTSIPAAALAPALLRHVEGNPNFKARDAGVILSLYTRMKLEQAFVRKVLTISKASLVPDKNESAGNIEKAAEILNESGWKADVTILNGDEMRDLVVASKKAEYDLALRNMHASDKAAADKFNPDDYDFSCFGSSQRFLAGWSLADDGDLAIFNNGLTTQEVQIDACHCAHGGILLRAFIQDAAHHMVPLLHMWSILNESLTLWLQFLRGQNDLLQRCKFSAPDSCHHYCQPCHH